MNRLHHGGVMRCCVETWEDHSPDQLRAKPIGFRMPCKYCTEGLVKRRDEDWEWWGAAEARRRLWNAVRGSGMPE